ncbi:hypothetical protein [Marixanthomonas spongiae]|uniref:Uncharacterized protein n=1 Tax=Marixanthomonas spongiae TaxID=2174845 RepID=A0A2U0I5J0_9FLAO|nr:hypothetical protein [Marixanthomonas spongiae]PVW16373.1 hypothetical protein DDV96_03695 [Marixanthomonas spongiae]
MKQTILSLFIFLSSYTITSANELFSFSLGENYKFEKTHSVNIGIQATIHLVVAKNRDTRNYDLLPFYVNANQEITQLETTSYDKIPEIISYHHNANTVTLLNYQDDQLTLVDFDIETGNASSKRVDDFEKPEHIFRLPNKTIFLEVDRRGEHITVTELESVNSIHSESVPIPEVSQKEVRRLFKEAIEEVFTDEYVKNGSISEFQAYYESDKFIIVKNDERKDFIETFEIDPKNPKVLSIKEFNLDKLDKVKDRNSYLVKDRLFSVVIGKKDLNLTINNLTTGMEEKSFLLSEDLGQGGISDDYKAFLKQAKRNKITSTVAVNHTKEGNYSVTIDYVDAVSYHYNHNWFFMHQMMWQQQMLMQQTMMPGGFGPNPELYNEVDVVYFKEKPEAITFVLSKQLDVLENVNPETTYTYVDKEKYMEDLDENKTIRNYSVGFLEHEYRYIYTDKKEEMIYIKTEPIE